MKSCPPFIDEELTYKTLSGGSKLHSAKWQSQDLNPDSLTSEAFLIIPPLNCFRRRRAFEYSFAKLLDSFLITFFLYCPEIWRSEMRCTGANVCMLEVHANCLLHNLQCSVYHSCLLFLSPQLDFGAPGGTRSCPALVAQCPA